ncbi:hypothetical protein [Guyparkeria sp.]|uniref:hypothetical protein n=1 Tax=Guyparkeria sp. TaxID=2035736 RepID=UPI003970840E
MSSGGGRPGSVTFVPAGLLELACQLADGCAVPAPSPMGLAIGTVSAVREALWATSSTVCAISFGGGDLFDLAGLLLHVV